MQERGLIVSQKFNVGHVSHIAAWYQLLESAGIETKVFLDKGYRKYVDNIDLMSFDEVKQYQPDIVIIYNISFNDPHFVTNLKKTVPTVKIYFVYHEPWSGMVNEVKKYARLPKDFLKSIARCICAASIAPKLEGVLLPSDYALNTYERHNCICPDYYYFPLLFKDETHSDIKSQKEYFSYISSALYIKGIDIFFKFVKWAAAKDKKIKFQVATKDNIEQYVDGDVKKLIDERRMIIMQGRELTTQEINAAYNRSCCTWLVYRSLTQSGVLPKTFMWGAPCIASNVGDFPKAVNGKNGIIISDLNDFDAILNAYNKIQHDFESYSKESRSTFLENYWVEKYVDYFREIISHSMTVMDSKNTQL